MFQSTCTVTHIDSNDRATPRGACSLERLMQTRQDHGSNCQTGVASRRSCGWGKGGGQNAISADRAAARLCFDAACFRNTDWPRQDAEGCKGINGMSWVYCSSLSKFGGMHVAGHSTCSGIGARRFSARRPCVETMRLCSHSCTSAHFRFPVAVQANK
jgi:hypothetical protein